MYDLMTTSEDCDVEDVVHYWLWYKLLYVLHTALLLLPKNFKRNK